MAVLTSPARVIPANTDAPHSLTEVVATTDIMKGGPPPIYTRPVLASPAVRQLLNTSGGYAV